MNGRPDRIFTWFALGMALFCLAAAAYYSVKEGTFGWNLLTLSQLALTLSLVAVLFGECRRSIRFRMKTRLAWWRLQELWRPSPPCPACGRRWFEGCTH